jgi:low temperature requirement protein LtrA
MVAGIVLMALGLEEVLASVGGLRHHELSDPLPTLSAAALYGGVALFLCGYVGFKYRTWHEVSVPRLVVGVLLLALIPVAAAIPALAALALLGGVMVVAIATEAVRYRELREQVRHDDPAAALHGRQVGTR